MPCAAVAVIGRKNNPLYIRTLVDPAGVAADASTQLHYIVHAALDVIEERAEQQQSQPASQYIGLLYPTEDFGVYGFVTNTGIKFVLVSDGDTEPADNTVKQFFKQLHELYIDTQCNPFHVVDAPLASSRFTTRVDDIIKSTRI